MLIVQKYFQRFGQNPANLPIQRTHSSQTFHRPPEQTQPPWSWRQYVNPKGL